MGILAAGERLEEFLELIGVDTRTAILYIHAHRGRESLDAHAVDAAAVPLCVLHQVAHDSLKTPSVGADDRRITCHQVVGKVAHPHRVQTQQGHIDSLDLQRIVSTDPGDLQQVEQHLRHAVHLLDKYRDQTRLTFGKFFASSIQQVRGAYHRRQR